MKKLLAACLTLTIFVIIGSSVSAADFTAADLKIDAIKQTLEIQLERIRNAREKADSQMSLARMRIAERLRLSSEELARQLEIMERLREQLSAGAGDSQQAINQLRSDWARLLETSFAEIDSQVKQANSLISQMEKLRDSFEDSRATDSTLTSQGPQMLSPSPGFNPSQPSTTAGFSPADSVTPAPTLPTMPSPGAT